MTVVFPYYGYSTLDKKNNQKIPIAAADVARMLEIIGVDKVACLELHNGQIQVNFLNIFFENLKLLYKIVFRDSFQFQLII